MARECLKKADLTSSSDAAGVRIAVQELRCSLFFGEETTVAFGDKAAGTNHAPTILLT